MSMEAGAVQDRVWTVPNILSFARLLGVPLFLWLILIEQDWWALGLLMFAGFSDWADGKLARMLNQTSKLGVVLDPAADRLYILATLVGLTVRDIIPLWLTLLLVARELAITPIVPLLRRLGYQGALPVHMVGKAGTMCLLYAFPLLLLAEPLSGPGETTAKIIGWSFAIWGTALYWWAAVLYWTQTRQLVLADRAKPPGPPERPQPSAPGTDPPAGDPKGAETAP